MQKHNILKDTLICKNCGAKMFPCAFDKEQQKITYKCIVIACGHTEEHCFQDVTMAPTEQYEYFCLNDEGTATWKCYCHGYCEFDIDSLMEKDFSKFVDDGCILAQTYDEVEDDFDYADGEGKEKLRKILTVLDAGQLSKLLEEQLSEVAPEDFEGDYIQALVTQFKINLTTTDDSSYSFDAFIDEILEMISDLFGISVDIYGIMEE
ncbi:hypothetical protein SDC9_62695 [bioreactor metagenome]|uniref:Uncharacterized protein n=1 Tax=bioreactor metagenome TaxID=1076179 RepID=A0A644XK10_9ZZZZ